MVIISSSVDGVRAGLLAAVFCAVGGCGGEEPVAEPDPGPQRMDMTIGGFATPESVLHDEKTDVYLVSNISGAPAERDNNGFISRLAPDGKLLSRKWIAGGRKGVELHAPKGMAIIADVLYVADIDLVRKFDRRTGKPLGSVYIDNAQFLNDMATAPDGDVYVTDTGINPDFSPAGGDAIYAIQADDVVATYAKGRELGQPNGIVVLRAGAYVVSWATGEFAEIDRKGRRTVPITTPTAKLDGLVRIDDGVWMASSWEGKCIYGFDLTGEVKTVLEGLDAPADLGYDRGRHRLLIPLFNENRVLLKDL